MNTPPFTREETAAAAHLTRLAEAHAQRLYVIATGYVTDKYGNGYRYLGTDFQEAVMTVAVWSLVNAQDYSTDGKAFRRLVDALRDILNHEFK